MKGSQVDFIVNVNQDLVAYFVKMGKAMKENDTEKGTFNFFLMNITNYRMKLLFVLKFHLSS